MPITFKRGIHPKYNKEITAELPITALSVPERLFVSLSQHIGAPAKVVVAVGDSVLKGSLIGEASGFVSSNIYSPVSGTVQSLTRRVTAMGTTAIHIEILNDGKYEATNLPILKTPTAEEIIERIKMAGIVGMGGATFPTHTKLKPPSEVDLLIINAAECEPYITCDYRMLLEYPCVFLEGVRYLKRALKVPKVIIGLEHNKEAALQGILDCIKENENIEVVFLQVKYPQGAEKQLLYAVAHRTVPVGKLPSDVGAVIFNVQTAYAVARAIDEGIPLYERVLTISGKAVKKPGNYLVATGTPYSYIESIVEGNNPAKIISGGPMMGFAQFTLNASVGKGTSSILFLEESEINTLEPSACINCGRCASVCPMMLMPMYIDSYVHVGEYKQCIKYGALNCIECGCCTYVCPAKRTLVQGIRLAKKQIKEKGIK